MCVFACVCARELGVCVRVCVLGETEGGVEEVKAGVEEQGLISAPNLLACMSGSSLKRGQFCLSEKQLPSALSALSDVDISNIFYKVKDN